MTRLAAGLATAATLIVGIAVAGTPTQAAADPCRPLLNSLVTWLQGGGGNNVQLFHTTNYQTNSYWGTAQSWGFLQPSTTGPILSGTVNRTWTSGYRESFPIEFYGDGSVRFAGQYGPYPTTCYGGKFLTVDTGDSSEAFSFRKGYLG